MTHIHPQAEVSPKAQLGRDVQIGPFCVVEPGAILGDGCRLMSHAVVKSGATLGENNTVGERAVLGGLAQHVSPPSPAGGLVIGSGNTFRESCTVHRSLYEHDATTIGDGNYVMVGVHVGHDCRVGSHVILANNIMLAGHVMVGDHAYLAGGVAVHQFCRIGAHVMVGGYARVKKDVPPYVVVEDGGNGVVGVNVIGLRRRGFTDDEIQDIKDAFRLIYRSDIEFHALRPILQERHPSGPAAEFSRFLETMTRGLMQARRQREPQESPTVRLVSPADLEDRPLRKAG